METVMVPARPAAGLRRFLAAGSMLTLAAGAAGLLLASCASSDDAETKVAHSATDKPAVRTADRQSAKLTLVGTRRITELQYRHAIADIFGPKIKAEGRFEPELRKDGLLAIGASEVSISDSGFAQYFTIARSIADQVLLSTPTQENQKAAVQAARDKVVPCAPARADAPDAACAEKFVRVYGERLFRHPLAATDVASRVKLAEAGAIQKKDFYHGLKLSLISLLTAPEFLFRLETAEPDSASPEPVRFDSYSKAARLSYFMWDAPPDPELLAAARDGSINTTAGLKAQIDRLVANHDRMEVGLRSFFTDMLDFNMFEDLTKDPKAYPKFSLAVAEGAREQTLRVLVDQLITKNVDYRDIFTTRDSFINRALAPVYKVPYTYDGEWTRFTFPPDSGQSGVLTEATFMMLFSHPGRSSPTVRGVKLSEIFMCMRIPPPPANVDFSKVRDSDAGTVRQRLLQHATNAGCSSCHLLSDPPGLALENFDGLGQFRTMESGQKIDVSVDWLGKKFEGSQGLGANFHDNPQIPGCLVRNVFAYGTGRAPDKADQEFIDRQTKIFAAKGYKVPELIADIAASPEFYRVKLPKPAAPAARTQAAIESAAPAALPAP
jgi:Protein of unknown function (DUF1592)/Protein of unknown function (DUF1588)/Protein of unknown function (DUF1585)/Protein of unknown function (DUF1595)/Protein of unknown function (DUF1587)